MAATIVPAREGRAVSVPMGARIRVTTPKGRQAADFFAFNAANPREWLSPPHSWVTTFSVKPRLGDVLISRFRRPMVKLVADGAAGCHDMMIAACDQFRYEFFGHHGPHGSCEIDVIPQPVNFFTNTRIEPDGRLVSPPNPVAPGAYVELEALMDLICVVSSCPFDLNMQGWEINAGTEISELLVEVSAV
jgi:uncharacterized protein YcgI (DUF1989 family)